jgi:hypothetical protein
MIDSLLRLFFRLGAICVKGNFDPPNPTEIVIDEDDPESILFAASILDQNGEWEKAILLYENVLQFWPDEYGDYSRNSIDAVRKKMPQA